MYRVTIHADIDADVFRASQMYSDLSEVVGKHNADEQYYEIEWIGEGDAPEPRDDLHCWCGNEARYAQPSVPSTGVLEPVCLSHVQDGYVGLDQFDDDELAEKLNIG